MKMIEISQDLGEYAKLAQRCNNYIDRGKLEEASDAIFEFKKDIIQRGKWHYLLFTEVLDNRVADKANKILETVAQANCGMFN